MTWPLEVVFHLVHAYPHAEASQSGFAKEAENKQLLFPGFFFFFFFCGCMSHAARQQMAPSARAAAVTTSHNTLLGGTR